MRTALFFAFCFFGVPVFCQDADSLLVVREVDSLIQVSRGLTEKRAFDKALEVNVVAEKLALGQFGRESVAYGSCCHNHGRVLYFKDAFTDAEKWYVDAINIRAKVQGQQHPDYAQSLNNLANTYMAIGHYKKAEPLHLEAKDIREKVLGKEHPDYAWSLSYLANLYRSMSQNEKAEPLVLEAIAIQEKVLSKEHPVYTYSLRVLGALYADMGQIEKVEPLFLKELDILEKQWGRENIDYASALCNLGVLYRNLRRYEKAENLILESIRIREKVLGKQHPDYAWSLLSLGTVYDCMGKYEKAEPLYLEAKFIQEKIPEKRYELSMTLYFLSNLCMIVGRYEEAESYQRESLSIREKFLGKEHPYYRGNLFGLARLYELQNRHIESESLLDESFILQRNRLSKFAAYLSERELNNHLGIDYRPARLFARRPAKNNRGFLEYDQILFRKGFLLTAATRLNTLATSSPEAYELNLSLKFYHRRLAAEYAKPIAERKGVEELEEKAIAAEKTLARTVAGYADAIRQVNWQEVQSALKPDEAAIEFVHFRVNFPQMTDSVMYVALILRPDAEQPHFIPLFEEKSLDSLLQTQGERKADYVSQLYSLADRSAHPLGKPQKTLYELLWKPLEKELAGVKTIHYSPSGLLHRLNLAAIPIGLDSVLGDRYNLVELGSTRQLVVPTTIKPAANDAVLFGGIAYDSDSTAMSQANAALDSISIASRGELSFAYTDSTLRVGTWSTLPFTDREVGSVEKTLKAAGFESDTRRGFAATEEAFKTLGAGGKASPRVLHLATHGFFFPDPKTTSARFETSPTFGTAEPVFKISDHPMIRSGLLLAGSNHAWATGKPLRPGMEDGILTAYEISQMNLSNTELVVLSACETGLGDIQGNEGVYGLQRAFKIAGAKYLIMSLWQVPDKQTSLLMTTFYKKWLEEKMAIPEAFRVAQRELREAGLDPYYWAGFVLVE